jgi:glutamate-5-semialdehyde dehydrogenase
MANSRVIIHADAPAYAALEGHYPAQWLLRATDDDFGTEYLDYAMAIKTVNNVDSAIDHIAHYGSGHSEAIVTADTDAADKFQMLVDAACVYVNSPTSFTDGAQFGLGAEIGISTQKLHARGPMALRELCTYKWLINGQGQTRP